jgi:hypothetical protein
LAKRLLISVEDRRNDQAFISGDSDPDVDVLVQLELFVHPGAVSQRVIS